MYHVDVLVPSRSVLKARLDRFAIPLLIVAAAALARFVGLDTDGLDHDEMWTASALLQKPVWQLRILWNDTHPPLWHLLLMGWSAPFGVSEPALRALSALLGVLAVLVPLVELPRWWGRRAAALVAVAVCFLPGHVYYSQEARNYALAFVTCLWTTTRLVAYIESGGARRARWLLALACALLVGSHYSGVLVVTAVMVAAVWSTPGSWGGRLRSTVWLALTTSCCCLPFVPHLFFARFVNHKPFFGPPFSLLTFKNYALAPCWSPPLGSFFIAGLGVAVLLAVQQSPAAADGASTSAAPSSLVMRALCVVALLPFALAVLLSVGAANTLLGHRLALVLSPPGIVVSLVAIATLLDRIGHRRARVAATAACALVFAGLGGWTLYQRDFYTRPKRDNVRHVAQRTKLLQRAHGKLLVVSLDPPWMNGLRSVYYFRRAGLPMPIGVPRGEPRQVAASLRARAARLGARVIVLVAGRRPARGRGLGAALARSGAVLIHDERLRSRPKTPAPLFDVRASVAAYRID